MILILEERKPYLYSYRKNAVLVTTAAMKNALIESWKLSVMISLVTNVRLFATSPKLVTETAEIVSFKRETMWRCNHFRKVKWDGVWNLLISFRKARLSLNISEKSSTKRRCRFRSFPIYEKKRFCINEYLQFFQRRMRYQRTYQPRDHDFYIMELQHGIFVDGKHKGNHSRFINHSCDPNCELVRWNVRGRIHIGISTLLAKRLIP